VIEIIVAIRRILVMGTIGNRVVSKILFKYCWIISDELLEIQH